MCHSQVTHGTLHVSFIRPGSYLEGIHVIHRLVGHSQIFTSFKQGVKILRKSTQAHLWWNLRWDKDTPTNTLFDIAN